MFLFLIASCVSPGTAPDIYMAKDGEWSFDPNNLCDTLNCRFDEVDEILNIVPEVDGVVDLVRIDPTRFTLRADLVGDTLLSISGLDKGSDLVERYVHIFVEPASMFRLGLRCDVMEPSQAPWVLPTNTDVYGRWTIWDTEYNNLYALPQFEAPGVTLSEVDADSRNAIFTMPDEADNIELRSALIADTIAEFQVVTDSQYDGFEANFWPDEPLTIGDHRRLATAMLVDGNRACIDESERILTISTPEVCSFSGEEPTLTVSGSGERLHVVGVSAGTCEVEVAVPAFGWSETLTLDVEAPETGS